jgi:hypothetical protein
MISVFPSLKKDRSTSLKLHNKSAILTRVERIINVEIKYHKSLNLDGNNLKDAIFKY